MKSILPKEYDELHKQRDSPPKLALEDKLHIMPKYVMEYHAMESTGSDYLVSKSTIGETIQWLQDTLSKDETFKLPGNKVHSGTPQEITCIVVEMNKSPIPHPKSVLFMEKAGTYHKDAGNH
jgi:hypothetical protein